MSLRSAPIYWQGPCDHFKPSASLLEIIDDKGKRHRALLKKCTEGLAGKEQWPGLAVNMPDMAGMFDDSCPMCVVMINNGSKALQAFQNRNHMNKQTRADRGVELRVAAHDQRQLQGLLVNTIRLLWHAQQDPRQLLRLHENMPFGGLGR